MGLSRADRAIEMLSQYTNPRTIAERVVGLMDEGWIDEEIVRAIFLAMQSDCCSDSAVTLLADRFISDYKELRLRFGGSAPNREILNVFLDDAVHYIRQLSQGRVRWRAVNQIAT